MVAKLWSNKEKDLLKGTRLGWGPPCLQIVPFPSLSQGEAEGAFLPSIAAWFIAVLAQRSCKMTGEIFPRAVAVPGLRRCPKALGFSFGVGTEASAMEELPPGRASSGHLAFALEACRAARVQKFLTSSSCLLPGFQRRLPRCSPSGVPRVLVGCSRRPAAASRERTCQLIRGGDPDCFLLAPRTGFPPVTLAGCEKGRLRWQRHFLLPSSSAWWCGTCCRSRRGQGWRVEGGVDIQAVSPLALQFR